MKSFRKMKKIQKSYIEVLNIICALNWEKSIQAFYEFFSHFISILSDVIINLLHDNIGFVVFFRPEIPKTRMIVYSVKEHTIYFKYD